MKNSYLNKTSLAKLLSMWAMLLVAISLISCRGVDVKNRSEDGLGELTLNITDAPIDEADSVKITITGFNVKEVGNDTLINIALDSPETIDVLDYQGSLSEEILDEYSLPVGNYESITLVLDETLSSMTIDGSQYELPIPAGSESGLTVAVNFTIEDDSDFDFTLDLDLRKSIEETTANIALRTFEFKPKLRIVRTDRAAHIVGTVASGLATQSSCDNNGTSNSEGNVVYVFQGSGATIQDYQGNSGDPVVSAIAEKNINQGYDFTIGFLEPGTYVLAFTCDGLIDNFNQNDFNNMIFSDGEYEIKLTAGEIESVDITD